MSPEVLASNILLAVAIYLVLGFVYGLYFIFAGVNRADQDAREGTIGFRLLILPGVTALWPLMVIRLIKGKPPEENNPHRKAAKRGGEA